MCCSRMLLYFVKPRNLVDLPSYVALQPADDLSFESPSDVRRTASSCSRWGACRRRNPRRNASSRCSETSGPYAITSVIWAKDPSQLLAWTADKCLGALLFVLRSGSPPATTHKRSGRARSPCGWHPIAFGGRHPFAASASGAQSGWGGDAIERTRGRLVRSGGLGLPSPMTAWVSTPTRRPTARACKARETGLMQSAERWRSGRSRDAARR